MKTVRVAGPTRTGSRHFTGYPGGECIFGNGIYGPYLLVVDSNGGGSFRIPVALVATAIAVVILVGKDAVRVGEHVRPRPSVMTTSSGSSKVFFVGP